MISHEIEKLGQDQGWCMIDANWGTVCLLQNADGSGMDTYRFSVDEWSQIVLEGTGNAMIQKVKASNGLKDPANSEAVEWMDAYFCTDEAFGTIECSAFQRKWKDGREQGYPRFGTEESELGELTYVKLTKSNAQFEEKVWVLEGASTLLFSGFAAALLLAF